MFGLFKIGVGPTLSGTVGPMKAASAFDKGLIAAPRRARGRRDSGAKQTERQMGVANV